MKEKHQRLTVCPNCQAELGQHDHFCRNCGQENHDLKVPFKHLFLEVLEGFLHLDGKSYRTAKALVLKPGFLTNEFRLGKRASYVPPIRLYVFISFIFFLVLSLTSGKHDTEGGKGNGETTNSLKMSFGTIPASELIGLNDSQVDSVLKAHDVEPGIWSRYLARKVGRMAEGGRAEVNHMLIRSLSSMMFLLMPLFGLLLYLFYRKASEYYLNCLIFSVHFHSFAFLALTLTVLISRFVDSIYLIFVPILILGAYLASALQRVYNQGVFKTAMKTILIGLFHLVGIFLSFMLTVFVGILLF